jgi:hypothetical protein
MATTTKRNAALDAATKAAADLKKKGKTPPTSQEVLAAKAKAKKAKATPTSEAENEAKKRIAEARKKEADAAKATKEAEKLAAQAKAEKVLIGRAKEVNTRLEKAKQYAEKADDFRLGASIILAEASAECKEVGITFKSWCEANITGSYDEARKLVRIGTAETESPGEGMKLLAAMREGTKERMQKHREKKKADSTTKALPSPDGTSTRAKPPGERALEAVAAMDKGQKETFAKSMARDAGLTVVSAERAKIAEEEAKLSPSERAEKAFNRLGAKAKIAFARWVCEQVGVKFDMDSAAEPEEEAEGDDPMAIPEQFKR